MIHTDNQNDICSSTLELTTFNLPTQKLKLKNERTQKLKHMNLFCALGYKEWMKTRRIIGVLIVLFIAVLTYTFIELTYAIRLDGAVNVWYTYIYQGTSVAPLFAWLPLIAGLSIALTQFVPEMTNKRLKLTLHLPAPESLIIGHMLLYGLCTLLLLFVLSEVILIGAGSCYLPSGVLKQLGWQLLPWSMAGIAVYGFTSWVCIEPQWKQRIWNALTGIAGVSIFYISQFPGVYACFLTGSIFVAILSLSFPLYSCVRFKNGIQ